MSRMGQGYHRGQSCAKRKRIVYNSRALSHLLRPKARVALQALPEINTPLGSSDPG